MDYLTPILVGVLLAAFFIIPQEIKRHKEIERKPVVLSRNFDTEIWGILMGVYTKLRQARVSCRPWVHDCIVAIETGRGCAPEIALAALAETGEDLAGTRWDTDKMAETFGEAAEKLAAMI